MRTTACMHGADGYQQRKGCECARAGQAHTRGVLLAARVLLCCWGMPNGFHKVHGAPHVCMRTMED